MTKGLQEVSHRSPEKLPLVTLAVVAFAVANATYSAWHQDWTYDEPFHIQWSQRLFETGVTERESQERFNSKTPVTLANVATKKLAQGLGVQNRRGIQFAARLPTVVWLLALYATIFLIARSLFDATVAHLATIGAALDPNIVAHGSLATSDVAYALATLLTLGSAFRFAQRPSTGRGAILGLAFGFAFCVKFTAVLLIPSLVLAPLVLVGRRDRGPREGWQVVAGSVAAVATATTLLCSAYLFRDVGVPLSARSWQSPWMTLAARVLPGVALPVPVSFLTGLDISFALERQEWNVYLLGRRHLTGVWYYFVVLWLIKTPVLLLAAQCYGLARAAQTRLVFGKSEALYLALNLLLPLSYFSFFFRAQIGYRFVFMCVPITCILAASGLASIARHRRAPLLGGLVVTVAVLENAHYFGNPLAFSSAAIWPKHGVFRLMADSNVDWGQNREKIHEWLAERPTTNTHLDPIHILPGHNTIGLNALADIWNDGQYRWLRENVRPSGHFGHTYVSFVVGEDVFDRFMDETRRLAPQPVAQTPCTPDLGFTHVPPDGQAVFSVLDGPDPTRVWIACVSVRKDVDFGLRALAGGGMRFGPYRQGAGCDGEVVTEGQVAWYRLERGVHAFCAAESPNARYFVPYTFEGRWLVRRHPARFNVRQEDLDREGRVLLEP